MHRFIELAKTWLLEARHQLTPYNVMGLLIALCLLVTMYLAYSSFRTQGVLQNVILRLEDESAANQERSEQNTKALCALRTERAADVARTEKFLRDNPGDPIVLGENIRVSRSSIQQDLENMRETVTSLSFVMCHVPKE